MIDQPITEGDSTGPRDPEQLEAIAATATVEISPETHMGAVHLTVADLGRSIRYYDEQIGLEVVSHDDGVATLGTGGHGLLVLTELPGAPPSRGHTGLYHFALLVPERDDLARWLAHAARDRVSLVGLSDHFVSEALYLRDPDHHGIEIYWDRPREVWQDQVGVRMTTEPLDVESLLGELDDPGSEPFDGLPGGTTMGHVHLQVAEIDSTVGFYRDLLGFTVDMHPAPPFAMLSRDGLRLLLSAPSAQGGGGQTLSDGRTPEPGGWNRFQIEVEDLAAEVERLRAAGARLRSEIVVGNAGDQVLVDDPSGNPVELFQAHER